MKRKKQSRWEEYDEFDDEEYVNEVLYEEGYRPQGKRKKKRSGVFLGILTFLLGIVITVFAFLLLFHIQKVEVVGNTYSTENDVIDWLKNEKYTMNSAYTWWKYNGKSVDQLPVVDSCKITFKAPWSIVVKVKEKEIGGYIEHNGQYLYFDKEGTVVLIGTERIEQAAYIEGLTLDGSKVKIGEMLPVSDKDVFKRIVEVSQIQVKYDLSPNRVICVDSEMILYFGNVEVLLGKVDYGERVAQIAPILQKLTEQNPDAQGTLHLENYQAGDKTVRFVPGEAPKTQEGGVGDETPQESPGEGEEQPVEGTEQLAEPAEGVEPVVEGGSTQEQDATWGEDTLQVPTEESGQMTEEWTQ